MPSSLGPMLALHPLLMWNIAATPVALLRSQPSTSDATHAETGSAQIMRDLG